MTQIQVVSKTVSLEIMREPTSIHAAFRSCKAFLTNRDLQQPERRDYSKETVYICNRTDTYVNSEAVTCTGMHRLKPDGISALRHQDGNEPPFLTRKLSVIDNHLQRKNGFCLMESHWVY